MPKKIIFLVNHVAFFVSHRLPIAKKLIENGYEVMLITGKKASEEMEEIAILELKANNIKHYRISISSARTNIFLDIFGVFQLIFLLIRFKPDLVHCVSPKALIYGGLACFFARVKSVVFSISGMGALFTADKQKFVYKILFNLLRNIYLLIFKLVLKVNSNSFIIVQNNDDKNKVINMDKKLLKKVHLIKGSGVDLNYYKNIDFNQKENIILFAGRMIKFKGVYKIIDAAKKVYPIHPNWKFVLVGAADYESPFGISGNELRSLVNEPNIEWIGHVTNIEDFMRSASIVCLPSSTEGMPKVLLEAAAAGCAVITTDVDGCREAIIDNVTGLLVPLDDQSKLVEATLNLIEDTKLRIDLGVNGIEYAFNNFGIDSVVDKHIEIYNNLLSKH
jgi:glycosyltransferase involved in cell wall biosynthesis